MVGALSETKIDHNQHMTSNDPMIKYMLKRRELYAREQKHDYSHVFRQRTRFEMFRLSAIVIAIEFAYSAETSFVSPILLQIGIDHKHMTMAWGLSPIIGFFISPILGSISDRCHLKWGRRRPIISILSFGIILGLMLVAYGQNIGQLLGDQASTKFDPVSSIKNNNGSIIRFSNDTAYRDYYHNNNNNNDHNDNDNDNDDDDDDDLNQTNKIQLAATQLSEYSKMLEHKYAIILTIVGMVLLDFDADTCQTPARTYLLDMCIPEDQPIALTAFSLFAGLGGTVGYALGAINWETTQIGSFLGGNIPTVFTMVAIIFLICYIITVTTFREIPLELIEKNELLRPLSIAAIKKEISKNKSNIFYIQKNNNMELQGKVIEMEMEMEKEKEKAKEKAKTKTKQKAMVMAMAKEMELELELEPELEKGDNEKYTKIYPITYQNEHQSSSLSSSSSLSIGDNVNGLKQQPIGVVKLVSSLDGDETIENSVTLVQYLKSIFVMPHSMKLLALTHMLCWMGHVTYCLYFTDFVGEAVFHGDPMATRNSEGAILYEAGVRFGCWGMAIYAFSCSIYSLSVTKLMLWFGTKYVYISGILYYAVGMLILAVWPTKWGVLVFSTSAGILYGTIFTMPYILIASYHSKNCFRVRDGEAIPLKQTRGLGTDVAIISSMVFIAQFIISLCMGPLIAWFQTTCAVLYISSLLAFFAAISAMFILYI